MNRLEFRGLESIRLAGDTAGSEDRPTVLLVPGIGQERTAWRQLIPALVRAGRRVIWLDLRGHGDSDSPGDETPDLEAYAADLRTVLGQLGTRPVVAAASTGGWIACMALERRASLLASGLILMDMPVGINADVSPDLHRVTGMGAGLQRLTNMAAGIELPTLYLCSAPPTLQRRAEACAFATQFPQGEFAEIDAGTGIRNESPHMLATPLIEFLERRVPHSRSLSEYCAGADARTLRQALGCFATGVTIVTTTGPDGEPRGLTANSFTSVSLDPPLLLVCIANTAASAPFLRQAERFAVNVLQAGQQAVSDRFARKDDDRFSGTRWKYGAFGTPILTEALSSFECIREIVHDAGDHFILLGRVQRVIFEPCRDPLLFFRGRYHRLRFA